MENKEIGILGAGLVGSLLADLLAQKGFKVSVFEKRSDPRKAGTAEGRSINLALSHRGIHALKMAGIYDALKNDLIPMKGRMMHDKEGELTFQPYGKKGQSINSVSRSGLNKALMTHAEKSGAHFHFEHKAEDIDLENTKVDFEGPNKQSCSPKILLGADGAFSALRQEMQKRDRFNFEQYYIPHGYKELSIPPKNGDFALEPNYLHIWPRGNFMLIALPNPDKSFTCTLFLAFEGQINSFEALKESDDIRSFFEQQFPDVIKLIPDLLEQFQTNPTSSLVTIRTYPWVYKNSLLIGDASHAIVPFYGQGMNAGFEDCRLFMEMGQAMNFDWDRLLREFSATRKEDADAIAELALKNFVEMRDKVADNRFLQIKKLESRLQDAYPNMWIPLYTMVTFSDIPYSRALKLGRIQEKVMEEVPKDFDPETIPLEPIIDRFNSLRQDAHLVVE